MLELDPEAPERLEQLVSSDRMTADDIVNGT
jgi:hypothetical protein